MEELRFSLQKKTPLVSSIKKLGSSHREPIKDRSDLQKYKEKGLEKEERRNEKKISFFGFFELRERKGENDSSGFFLELRYGEDKRRNKKLFGFS